jgi:hypothetical protein
MARIGAIFCGSIGKKLLPICVLSLFSAIPSFSQASIVRNRLQLVAMGRLDEVRRELPDLLAEYPEDPGIQFLHAVVLEDATRALPIYQRIVKEKPDCEWADDAQWRIVQYYALRRDTMRARNELTSYRKSFPQSEFLLSASDLVRAAVGSGRSTAMVENSKMIKPEENKAAKTAPMVKSVPAAENPVRNAKEMAAENQGREKTEKVISAPKPEAAKANTDAKAVAVKTAIKEPAAKEPARQDNNAPASKIAENKPAKGGVPAPEKNAAPAAEAKAVEKPEKADKSAKKSAETVKTEEKSEPKAKATEKNTAEEAASDSGAGEQSKFSLQVGIFATKKAAESEVAEYQKKRLRSAVMERKMPDGSVKYSVIIGEYKSRKNAEEAIPLVKEQCNCFPLVLPR